MNNVGLIVFDNIENSDKKDILNIFTKLKKLICMKIKRLFSTKLPEHSIKKITVDQDLNLFFIKLPYSLDELRKLRRFSVWRLQKAVLKACRDNSIKKCFYPSKVPDKIINDFGMKNPFSGNFIYASLLVNILKLISVKKDMDIRDLDIAILETNNRKLLHFFIRQLSPLAKFLTIITKEKESAQKDMEDIFDETGLSVRVTDDIASGLDGISILINIGNLDEFIPRKKVICNAVVINYGSLKNSQVEFTGGIIDQINVGLPASMEESVDEEFINCYTGNEIAEIIFVNKLNGGTNVFKDFAEYNIMKGISEQFEEEGYTISLPIAI